MKKIEEFTTALGSKEAFENIQKAIDPFVLEDQYRIVACTLSNIMLKRFGRTYKNKSTKHSKLVHAIDFIDHPATLTVDGQEIECFEPYRLGYENIKKLFYWCEQNGYGFSISSESPHFPGRTMLIMVYRKGIDL